MASAVVAGIGPAAKSLQAAYNPILLYAQVYTFIGARPPVVYADVYFNGAYYKTLSSSSVDTVAGSTSYWRFDLSGLAQEYLTHAIPAIYWPFNAVVSPIQALWVAPPSGVAPGQKGAATCYVKFRLTSIDAYGVITPETPAPVQATVDSAALAGTGFPTDTFTVVNAALQWSTDMADLESHLKTYRRTGNFSDGNPLLTVESTNRIYQLSRLHKGVEYTTNFGQLPILIAKDGFSIYVTPGGFVTPPYYVDSCNAVLVLEMYDKDGAIMFTEEWGGGSPITLYGNSIYSLPTGIRNVRAAFPSSGFYFASGCAYYQLYLHEMTALFPSRRGNVLFVTPKYFTEQVKISQPARHVRIWYRNYMGHLDALNFRVEEGSLKVGSDPTEWPRITNGSGTGRQQRGAGRNNVRSSDIVVASDVFTEDYVSMLKELFASTDTYIETTNVDDPTGNVKRILMPIVVEDGDMVSMKYEERYEYQTSIKYRYSHENYIVR